MTELISATINYNRLTIKVAHWIQPTPVEYYFETKKPLWYLKVFTSDFIFKNPSKPKYFPNYKHLEKQFLRIDAAIKALEVVEHIELYGKLNGSDIFFKDFMVFIHLFLSAAWDYQQLIDKYLLEPPYGLEYEIPKKEVYDYEVSYYHKELNTLKSDCHTKALGIWEISDLTQLKEG